MQLYTVKQFAAKHAAFSEGSLRWLLFHRAGNGLEASGALLHNGRRILIDESGFFDWLKSRQPMAGHE